MNKVFRSVVAMLALAMIIASCKSDDPIEQSETDRVTSLLTSGAWKVQSVSIDNVDKTASFSNLQLTFSNGSFTSTNGNIVWPSTGTWTFTDATAKAFTRNDGVTVNIGEISDSKLVLVFLWNSTTLGPGRISSVAGTHSFTFTR